MSDLIDREALLRQIDIDSEGEPGYYGDTWKFIDTIKNLPSAIDKNAGTELSTNLAEVGTDLISREQAIDAVRATLLAWSFMPEWRDNKIIEAVKRLPPIQPVNNSENPNSSDAISRQAAIDDIWTVSPLARLDRKWVDRWLRQLPPIQPTDNLQKLADEIASFKRHVKSDNSDYLTGYLCALSVVEGMIADMRGEQDGKCRQV